MLGLVRLFVNNVTNDPRLFFAIFLLLLHIYKTSFVEFSSGEIFRTGSNLESFSNGCGFGNLQSIKPLVNLSSKSASKFISH